MPKTIPATAARSVNSTTDSSAGEFGVMSPPSLRRSLPRQPPVQLHVLLALFVPGEVLRHAVGHQFFPGGAVGVGVEGVVEGPAQAGGDEVIEDDAGALAGGGVEELDGVGEAAGFVNDRGRAVLQAVQLVQ